MRPTGAPLRIPIDLIRQLIEKASRAWSAVLAAPIRFIRSALQAILRGVGRFVGNFLSHLWYGVQGWLFNAVSERGITPPSSWTDFRAVFGFVLQKRWAPRWHWIAAMALVVAAAAGVKRPGVGGAVNAKRHRRHRQCPSRLYQARRASAIGADGPGIVFGIIDFEENSFEDAVAAQLEGAAAVL